MSDLTGAGPLAGYRILEVGSGAAAAVCTLTLAGLGATVCKVEPPEGDPMRREGPFPGDVPNPEASAAFIYFNGGKLSLTLDLEDQEGPAQLKDLALVADAVVESFPPGHLDRLGLGYETLSRSRPALVMTSVTPFGQYGPYSAFTAEEITLQAMGGLMATTGEPDREPLASAAPLARYSAGLVAALGTLAALWQAAASGQGQHVDVSEQEALMQCLEHTIITYSHRRRVRRRGGSRHPDNHPMTIYPCRDGYVSASIGFGQWELFCALVDRPQWRADEELLLAPVRRQRADELDEVLLPWFRQRTAKEIVEQAQRLRLPFGYVLDVAELLQEPHLFARNYFREVEQPGVGAMTIPGPPFAMSESPWATGAAPRLGEHSGKVLSEWLDRSR